MKVFILFGAAAILLSSASVAAPPSLAVKATAETALPQTPIPDNAMRLSALLNPRDKLLDVGMRGFQAGIDAQLKKSPEDAAVYDQDPGLLDAIIAAARPIMLKHLEATIPVQQEVFARFFAEKFSPGEVDQLIAFYSTPTGSKVIAAMYAGLDLDKLASAMGKNDDGNFTAKNIDEATSAAASTLPDKFDADDWKALFMFVANPVDAKLKQLAPELNQLAAKIGNEPDPAMDAEIEAAIEGAVKAYMARKKAKHAS